MKERSRELNEKMKDIRWCFSTMTGIIKEACSGLSPVSDEKEAQVIISFFTEQTAYSVTVGYHPPASLGASYYSIAITLQNDGKMLRLDWDWAYTEIDLVHADLDAVISACEAFCNRVGRGKEFGRLMTRFRQ